MTLKIDPSKITNKFALATVITLVFESLLFLWFKSAVDSYERMAAGTHAAIVLDRCRDLSVSGLFCCHLIICSYSAQIRSGCAKTLFRRNNNFLDITHRIVFSIAGCKSGLFYKCSSGNQAIIQFEAMAFYVFFVMSGPFSYCAINGNYIKAV